MVRLHFSWLAKKRTRSLPSKPSSLQSWKAIVAATIDESLPDGFRVRSAPQQALLAENPHDHGADDQREEDAKPPEAIRAHHAPPPLRDCHRRGQQALSHGESGAKSGSYLGEAR